MRIELTAHDSADAGDLTVTAETERNGTELLLLYTVEGPIRRLTIPCSSLSPRRRDGLWRQTCFEAFVRSARSPAYHELNLSPAGDWAFYHFDQHREGMASPDVGAPAIDVTITPELMRLSASLDLATLISPAVPWELNLSAVLEGADGVRSYWALAHPPAGPPDFHHPDCFVLRLPPPAAA